MARIKFCCWLRHWSGGLEEIDVDVTTVRAAMIELSARFDRIPPEFIDSEGNLTSTWQIWINNELATKSDMDDLRVSPDDEIYPLPKILLLTPEETKEMKRKMFLRDKIRLSKWSK